MKLTAQPMKTVSITPMPFSAQVTGPKAEATLDAVPPDL